MLNIANFKRDEFFSRSVNILKSSLKYLACPKDKSELILTKDVLLCSNCNSKFKVIDGNTIDFVSTENEAKQLSDTESDYDSLYTSLVSSGNSTEKYRRDQHFSKVPLNNYIKQYLKKLKKLIGTKIILDIGSGRGDYSLELSKNCELVFHCDLDSQSMNIAKEEAVKKNLRNILFVRCDYFSLPFKTNSLPCCLCVGNLYHGKDHDFKLITAISDLLEENGLLIMDFQSKERSKIHTSKSIAYRYSKNELENLLKDFSLTDFKIEGNVFFPQFRKLMNKPPFILYRICDGLCKMILPPARWLVIIKNN